MSLLVRQARSRCLPAIGWMCDSARYEAFIAERDAQQQILADLQTQALSASADHDLWLATAEGEHVDDPKTLAAAFASYDRDNYSSAIGLEMSLALMLGSMSQPVPSAEDRDLRFKRLEKWLDQHDSPLYLALAPFNPFRDRADAAGTLIGATDSTIEVLAGRFPAIADITDLTAQAVYTVVLKRLNGQTRWDASHSFQQRVLAAVQEANAEKAVGLLSTRYKITGQAIRESGASKAVTEFIDAGMAQIEESKALRISGSRTVTLEMTTTQTVKPKAKAILRSVAGAGLNAGMLWLNIVNLKAAYANVQKSSAPEYTTGFASAIFGVIGSLTATLVTTRAAQKSVIVKLSSSAPGMAFGNGLITFVTSKAFTRIFGYPAIISGLASDLLKALRQSKNGDRTAGMGGAISGITIAIGSAVVLEASFLFTGAIALISLAALKAVTIALLGVSILTAGLYLQGKIHERLHSPLELWAARSTFGNLQNDGEERLGIQLDHMKKLPRFLTFIDELQSWYATYYTPLRLTHEQAQALGIDNFNSKIFTEFDWPHPDWGTIVQTGVEHSATRGEITVFLRGYLLGQSTWTASLSHRHPLSKTTTWLKVIPTLALTAEGLLINFSTALPPGSSINLSIDHFPNQGIAEDLKSTATLSVSPHE
ncbi:MULTISPECIES: hypothetical protein [unclassified Pseudomonas]|uniref:hypothetical protein n=1 Tax=unclassified Pseudomonas TaxID=196821 RepID=UPI00380B0EA2